MGIKKKEEKKQEDVIDISTLPPCKTLLTTFTCHPYLSALNKYLKVTDFKLITRDDLLLALKEKSMEANPQNLALICKTKLEELTIPIRKEKKDSPRRDDSKFDLILVLKNYPMTSEESTELDTLDLNIEIFLYLRPNKSRISVNYSKKLEAFNTKLMELTNAGSDISALVQPSQPDLYPGSLMTLHSLSLHKNNYQHAIIHVEEFDTEEDLEFKEEVKEEKEETKKKDLKAPVKKGEEPKEEEIDPNDPKLKFCHSAIEKIKALINARIEYETWKKNLVLAPLYPETSKAELRPSKSQVSVGSSTKRSEHEKIVSLDDIPKTWDFTYYHSCINHFSESAVDYLAVLSCIFRWISRDSLSSRIFHQVNSKESPIKITEFNNYTFQKVQNAKYYLSEEFLYQTLKTVFNDLTIPEVLPNYLVLPADQRSSLTTSLLYYTSFDPIYFERYLNVLNFEKLLLKIHPERTWDLGNRKFEETFDMNEFSQIFLKLKMYEPEILTEYIQRTDSLLVAVLFRTPPGRIIRKAWRSRWRVCPNFSQYLNMFEKSDLESFFNIDPKLVGCIKERVKIMYPADNSVIKMIEYHVAGRNKEFSENSWSPRFRGIVFKDNWYFGVRKGSNCEFWARFGDERILAEMTENGLELTFTMDSGLLIKFLPSGEILQQKPGSDEENRIIFPNGSVSQYKKDGSTVLLMPKGEVSTYGKDKLWIITNNKGKRVAKRGRQLFPLDPISVTSQIDAETLAKVTVREDLVLTLCFNDGSTGVFHEDGTRIHTSSDKNTIYVESPGYAPVRIYRDPIKARQNTVIGLGSSDSGLGAEDLMLRSNDGVLIEVVLPNKCKVQSIVQKQELEAYNQFSVSRVHLVQHSDGAVLKTTQDGEAVLITAQARDSLAQGAGKDAYFYDIFTLPEERNSGVYTARVDQGRLFTKDDEGNYFEVTTEGKAIERLAVSLNVEDTEPESPIFDGEEYIDPECKFLPPPATIIPPRVFLIHENKVHEYLEDSQLDYHFRNFEGKYYKEEGKITKCHTWLQDKADKDSFSFPDSPFDKYSLPKLVKPMLQTIIVPEKPKQVKYVRRVVKEFEAMDEDKRKSMKRSLEMFEEWNRERLEEKAKAMIVDPRNEGELTKFNGFSERLAKFRGVVEVKVEKEDKDEDQVSDFYVELSDEELPGHMERTGMHSDKINAFKIEPA